MSNDGFTQKQLEQLGLVVDIKLQPINQQLTNIENRLTNVENRLEAIENCPTIKKELKQ